MKTGLRCCDYTAWITLFVLTGSSRTAVRQDTTIHVEEGGCLGYDYTEVKIGQKPKMTDASALQKTKSDFLKKKREGGAISTLYEHLREMAESICLESIHKGESKSDLEHKLWELETLLDEIQYVTNPELAYLRCQEEERLTEDEKKRKERISGLMWRYSDPRKIFDEGCNSSNFQEVEREFLVRRIADYLSKPWLQNNKLEYHLVSLLVFLEVVQAGEAVKKRMCGVGSIAEIFGNIYYKSEGNKAKIDKFLAARAVRRVLLGGFILAGFYYYLSTPYAILLTVAYLAFSNRFWMGRDTLSRLKATYNHGYDVWTALESPVINPKILRDKLTASASGGAEWHQAIYTMVDLWVQRNPSLFLLDGPKHQY